ncbi:MAG: amidohydrolase, partial [Muriicola sp.]|nr:amidohydrolase [Muriicola sp.]
MKHYTTLALVLMLLTSCSFLFAQTDEIRLEALKTEVQQKIDDNDKMAQVMVDKVFSFAELGFHEKETANYITGILEKNGFKIERGISGVPTAWWASWGSGKPVIAIGSDVDCIPRAS